MRQCPNCKVFVEEFHGNSHTYPKWIIGKVADYASKVKMIFIDFEEETVSEVHTIPNSSSNKYRRRVYDSFAGIYWCRDCERHSGEVIDRNGSAAYGRARKHERIVGTDLLGEKWTNEDYTDFCIMLESILNRRAFKKGRVPQPVERFLITKEIGRDRKPTLYLGNNRVLSWGETFNFGPYFIYAIRDSKTFEKEFDMFEHAEATLFQGTSPSTLCIAASARNYIWVPVTSEASMIGTVRDSRSFKRKIIK